MILAKIRFIRIKLTDLLKQINIFMREEISFFLPVLKNSGDKHYINLNVTQIHMKVKQVFFGSSCKLAHEPVIKNSDFSVILKLEVFMLVFP